MSYIIGLFLILAVIFASTGGNGLLGNIWQNLNGKISQTLFPKTEREILIDNLNSNYQSLDKFFSEATPTILNSKAVSEKDKTAVKKAVEIFNNSKTLISDLSKIEKQEKGPLKTAETLVGTLMEKVLNINSDRTKTSPDPTNIPPQCKLVCEK